MATKNNDSFIRTIWAKQSLLHRFLRSRLPGLPEADVEDVVQETYTAAVRHADNLDNKSESGLLTWLCTVARRKGIDTHRTEHAKKRGGSAHKLQLKSSAVVGRVTTPSSFAARGEGKRILEEALAKLPPRDRTAIATRYFDRQPHSETAKRLGISEKAAQMLTQRALEKLRKLIGNESRIL